MDKINRTPKAVSVLDGLYYIAAQFGIFIAAAKGSLVWVCVCGFCLLDGAISILFRKYIAGKGEADG